MTKLQEQIITMLLILITVAFAFSMSSPHFGLRAEINKLDAKVTTLQQIVNNQGRALENSLAKGRR